MRLAQLPAAADRRPAVSYCRLEGYEPVLLIFYVGLGEIAKVYFE
jgi:hypothetical protein